MPEAAARKDNGKDLMRRAASLILAIGVAFSLAGCATGRQLGTAASSGVTRSRASSAKSSAKSSAPSTDVIKDFDLRVKCPGIHLEKTCLGWSEAKIMKHENVTRDQIARCEAWTYAQPKGYVPDPPSPINANIAKAAGVARDARRSTAPRK